MLLQVLKVTPRELLFYACCFIIIVRSIIDVNSSNMMESIQVLPLRTTAERGSVTKSRDFFIRKSSVHGSATQTATKRSEKLKQPGASVVRSFRLLM